jgi:hypothetical protein
LNSHLFLLSHIPRAVNLPSRDLPKVSLHVAKLPTSAANSSTPATTHLAANHVSNLSISETSSPSPTAAFHAAHHAANLPISAAFLRRPAATYHLPILATIYSAAENLENPKHDLPISLAIPKGKKSTSTRQLRTNLFYHSISRALQVKSNEQGNINPQCQCDTKDQICYKYMERFSAYIEQDCLTQIQQRKISDFIL